MRRSSWKLVALGDRARNEPRDLYDAWYLTTEGHVDLGHMKAEVESKLQFRGRTLATLGDEFQKKEARLKKLWSMRLAAQMAELPEFDGIFREVQRVFPAGWPHRIGRCARQHRLKTELFERERPSSGVEAARSRANVNPETARDTCSAHVLAPDSESQTRLPDPTGVVWLSGDT